MRFFFQPAAEHAPLAKRYQNCSSRIAGRSASRHAIRMFIVT
jgi:hypothetical protein